MPWSGPPPEFPLVYRIGDVIAYALAIGFLAVYLWMVSAESRDRARALVATEAALTREARMNALGSLAAAAAHQHRPAQPDTGADKQGGDDRVVPWQIGEQFEEFALGALP